MGTTVVTLIPVLLLASGAGLPDGGAEPNRLSDQERHDGWKLLFDGKSASQWRGYGRKDLTGVRWAAQDGCLAVPGADGKDTHGSRDIVSIDTYGDFELTWDWRISTGGNSGLKYLVTEDNQAAALGHEYQMIDDALHPDAKKRDSRRTGSLYDVFPAPAARPRPAGAFNQSRILVQGKHVEHWLNGTRILAYELDSDALRAAVANSKFKDVSGFDKPRKAHLLLQDHGFAVCFRNLKIREPRR